jgi:hypothetical protein
MPPETTSQQTDGAHVYHATPDESPSEAVIRATVDAIDMEAVTDASSLPPLYEAVDPDALNAVLAPDRTNGIATVRFRYMGYDVTMDGTGQVTLVEG